MDVLRLDWKVQSGRNKTRDQRPEPGTKIRDQILSAEYGYLTFMYQAEIKFMSDVDNRLFL